jgi:hypothetical protein
MPTGYAPGGGFGGGLAAPRKGFVPGAPALAFDEDAFATRREDHLGLTLAKRRATLLWWLPQGTVLYAGLWTQMPNRAGAGGVEVDDANYERVQVSRWLTVTEGASARRNNANAIQWPIFDQPQTLVGWGLFTASTGDTLEFFDHLRTSGTDRVPVAFTVPAGARFGIGSGRNGIGLVF